MNFQKLSYDSKLLVDLNNINLEPGPFTISFGFDPVPLMESINRIGLIHPPFIIKDSNRGFHVVSGYRRMIALKHLDNKQVECIDLSNSGLSEKDLFLLNLYENLTIRTFNLVEKGMIVNGLSSFLSREEIIKHYISLIQISNVNNLDVVMKINQLNEQTRLSIAQGLVSLKTVRLIINMEKRARDVLMSFIINLKLNINYQYQFIEYLKDISEKENLPIHKILETDQYQNIIKDKKSNNPQKIKHLFKLIKEHKFPFLTQSENLFRNMIMNLNLPDKTRIEHPPFFEEPDFRLEIFFQNGKELLKKIKYLSNLEAITSINPPWKANE